MEALHDVVRAGKARYLGASSMYAWQFAKAQHVAERNGWTRFVSMQNHYNLIYREEEREMVPLCLDQGVGMIPWSPLARGHLARAPEAEGTKRSGTDGFGKALYGATAEADRHVIAAVDAVAKARKAAARAGRAGVAARGRTASRRPSSARRSWSTWTTPAAAVDVKLSEEEVKALEAPYVPHAVSGHS